MKVAAVVAASTYLWTIWGASLKSLVEVVLLWVLVCGGLLVIFWWRGKERGAEESKAIKASLSPGPKPEGLRELKGDGDRYMMLVIIVALGTYWVTLYGIVPVFLMCLTLLVLFFVWGLLFSLAEVFRRFRG
ncbi:MAG: hypothetical protein L0338_27900 [Acidobacteria bacterium]|nr:hypothetical protein [Acidobacteriota bacterium]